jgi:hypothetical protein
VTAGLVLSPQSAALADALQDIRDGSDAVVSEHASCTVDGTVAWEEHGYLPICLTLGDARTSGRDLRRLDARTGQDRHGFIGIAAGA